jgi:hypothetical protein
LPAAARPGCRRVFVIIFPFFPFPWRIKKSQNRS